MKEIYVREEDAKKTTKLRLILIQDVININKDVININKRCNY